MLHSAWLEALPGRASRLESAGIDFTLGERWAGAACVGLRLLQPHTLLPPGEPGGQVRGGQEWGHQATARPGISCQTSTSSNYRGELTVSSVKSVNALSLQNITTFPAHHARRVPVHGLAPKSTLGSTQKTDLSWWFTRETTPGWRGDVVMTWSCLMLWWQLVTVCIIHVL